MHAHRASPSRESWQSTCCKCIIDKNTVLHFGMVREPVSIFLPFCKTWRLFLSAGTGRTSLTRNSIPSKLWAAARSCIRGSAGTLRFNSPFIWLSVTTHFSLKISSRRCLISSSTSTFFRPPRGISLIRHFLMYWASIPLAMERFTPNVSATNCLVLKSTNYSLSVFYRNPISSWHFMQVYGTVRSWWPGTCNSHTTPMSRHFYRLIYF